MKNNFLSAALIIWVTVAGCDARYKPSCRKVEVGERVSCGYPGISKKDCLKDCHCCYDDNGYKRQPQCFFREPPAPMELCCDMKDRVPCRLHDEDLDNDPYKCRQLGCCYDGNEFDYGRRSGQGKAGVGGDCDSRRDGGRSEKGGSTSDDQPTRCYKTSPDCCEMLVHHVHPTERKKASYGSVNRRQCLRNRNACWDFTSKPQCFYKFPPCRCPINSLNCKLCGDDHSQHRLDDNFNQCIDTGCCYRAATSEYNNCFKPRRGGRGRNADIVEDGMADVDYSMYDDDVEEDSDIEDTEDVFSVSAQQTADVKESAVNRNTEINDEVMEKSQDAAEQEQEQELDDQQNGTDIVDEDVQQRMKELEEPKIGETEQLQEIEDEQNETDTGLVDEDIQQRMQQLDQEEPEEKEESPSADLSPEIPISVNEARDLQSQGEPIETKGPEFTAIQRLAVGAAEDLH